MILRNSNTGALQVYGIANSQISDTAALGTVGLDWQVGGFGNFSSRGTSDMIMRNSSTGGLQVYAVSFHPGEPIQFQLPFGRIPVADSRRECAIYRA